MKNLLLILIAFLAACNNKDSSDPMEAKDTIVRRSTPPPPLGDGTALRSTAPGNFTLAHSFSDTVSACRTTAYVKRLGNESGRGFFVCLYTALGTFVQCGYKNNGPPIIEYYFGPGISNVTVLNQSPIIMNAINTFHIKHIGDGWWVVGRNGVDVIKFYEGSTYGRNVRTGIEYYGSNQRFPEINCPKAIEILINGQWVIPHASYVTHCGKWGVSGDEQNSDLQHGELSFAGDNKPLPLNTWLFKDF